MGYNYQRGPGWAVMTFALALPSLSGCASLTVEHDFDREANFSAYQTFDWMPAEARRVDLQVRDPMVETRIRDAITAELRSKGLRRSTTEEPDVRIGYLLVVDSDVESQTIYESSDPNWRYRTYAPGRTTTTTAAFRVGTLVIDIFDEGQVKPTQTPEENREKVNEAVKKILEEYPPGG